MLKVEPREGCGSRDIPGIVPSVPQVWLSGTPQGCQTCQLCCFVTGFAGDHYGPLETGKDCAQEEGG